MEEKSELEENLRKTIEKASAEEDNQLMSAAVNKLADEFRDKRFGLRRTRKIINTLDLTRKLLNEYKGLKNRAFEMKYFQMIIKIIKREFLFLDYLSFHPNYHGIIIEMTEKLWRENSSEFGVLDENEELFACIAKSLRKGFENIAGIKYFKAGFEEMTQFMYKLFQDPGFREMVQRQPGFLVAAHMPYSSPATPEHASISFEYINQGYEKEILNKEQYRDLMKRLILEFSANTEGHNILAPFNLINLRFSKNSRMIKELPQIDIKMDTTVFKSPSDKKGTKKNSQFGGTPLDSILHFCFTELRYCTPNKIKQGRTFVGKKPYIEVEATGENPTTGEKYECKLEIKLPF